MGEWSADGPVRYAWRARETWCLGHTFLDHGGDIWAEECGPGRLCPGSTRQAYPEVLAKIIITGGPRFLSLQGSSHPFHCPRMLRGARPRPGGPAGARGVLKRLRSGLGLWVRQQPGAVWGILMPSPLMPLPTPSTCCPPAYIKLEGGGECGEGSARCRGKKCHG